MAVCPSRVGERDNRMILYLDEDHTTYRYVSNFIIRLTCEVEAGSKSGYLCNVIYYTGDTLGKAYFTQEDVNYGRKRWVKALCSSLQSTRPQCPEISDKELAYFLMYKTDSFLHENPNAKKVAATVTGLQHPPTWVPQQCQQGKVWVLNAEVQIDENGSSINPDESPYIWLGDVCAGRPEIFQPEVTTRQRMIADSTKKSTAALPLDPSALHHLITTLEAYYSHNFPAAMFVLGGFVLAVHYESLIDQYGCVPATIAYGQVQCGKSKATKAVLSTVGLKDQNYFNQVSDSRAFEFSSQTTLGMVIDDPEDPKQISKKLVYHFQKAHASTMAYEYQPRTTFLSSMNLKMLRKLSREARLISRAVLVHFKEVCPRTSEEQDDYDIMLDEAMELAPSAAGEIIALGKTLVIKRQEFITNVLPQVQSALPEAIHRVQRSYGLALFAALQLLEKVGLREKYEGILWSYLSMTVSQTVSDYQVEAKQKNMLTNSPDHTPFTSEEVGKLLVKAVEGLKPTQILRFMRIDRKATARGHSSPKPCVSFYVRAVCETLATKGIEIKPDNFYSRLQHFPINTTNPQWFLNEQSELNYIPSSRYLMSVHGQQRKCCQIYKSVFEDEVISTLKAAIYPEKEKENEVHTGQVHLHNHSSRSAFTDSDGESETEVSNLQSHDWQTGPTSSFLSPPKRTTLPPLSQGSTLTTPTPQSGPPLSTPTTPSPQSGPPLSQGSTLTTPTPQSGPPLGQGSTLTTPTPQSGPPLSQGSTPATPTPQSGPPLSTPTTPSPQSGPPLSQGSTPTTPSPQSVPPLSQGSTLTTPSPLSGPPLSQGSTRTTPTPQSGPLLQGSKQTHLINITNVPADYSDATTASMALKKALAVSVSETPSSRKGSRKRKTSTVSSNPKKKSRSKINQNKCSVCQGRFVAGEEANWVGCDFCPRWYHKNCVSATINSKWRCSIDTCATSV